jgi:hypothetical protein
MGKNSEMHIAIQNELMNLSHQALEGELSNLDALIEMRNHRQELEKNLKLIKDFEDNRINEIAYEASQYPEGYKGFKIKMINGRKNYFFKNIPEWNACKEILENCEKRYKMMFEAKIKGLVHANISEEGEELPLPQITYSKSWLSVEKIIKDKKNEKNN